MLKTKVIPVRLDDATWDVIQRAAKSAGRSASGYLRHAAIEAALREGHSNPAVLAERRRVLATPARSAARHEAQSPTWEIETRPIRRS